MDAVVRRCMEDGAVFLEDADKLGMDTEPLEGVCEELSSEGLMAPVMTAVWALDGAVPCKGALADLAFVTRAGRTFGHRRRWTAAFGLGILPDKWPGRWPEPWQVAKGHVGQLDRVRATELGVELEQAIAPVDLDNRLALELLSVAALLAEKAWTRKPEHRWREYTCHWRDEGLVSLEQMEALVPFLPEDERAHADAMLAPLPWPSPVELLREELRKNGILS